MENYIIFFVIIFRSILAKAEAIPSVETAGRGKSIDYFNY